MMEWLVTYMTIGCVLGAGAHIVYEKILLPRRWPIRVNIFEKVGQNAYLYDDDRAVIKKSKKFGIETLTFKKRRENIEPPSGDTIYIDKKGKKVLLLFTPQKGEYHPMKIESPKALQILDKDVQFWMINQFKHTNDIYRKKESFLEKYMPFVMIIVVASVLVFVTIMFFTKIGELGGALNSMSANMARVAEAMAKTPAETTPTQPAISPLPPLTPLVGG